MPEFTSPLEEDLTLQPKVRMYEDAMDSRPDFSEPADPRDNPVDDVDYDGDGFPILPPDLTAITSRQLGQIFQVVEAWHEYLNYQLTEADAEATSKREIRDLAKARIKEELKKGGIPATERTEVFVLDPRYVYANSEYLRARTFAARIEAIKNRLSKRFQLISREISRRGESSYFGNMNPDNRFSNNNQRRMSRYDGEGETGEESTDGQGHTRSNRL